MQQSYTDRKFGGSNLSCSLGNYLPINTTSWSRIFVSLSAAI